MKVIEQSIKIYKIDSSRSVALCMLATQEWHRQESRSEINRENMRARNVTCDFHIALRFEFFWPTGLHMWARFLLLFFMSQEYSWEVQTSDMIV